MIRELLGAIHLLLSFCLLAYAFYALLTIAAALSWRNTPYPTHSDALPFVSILKPVHGVDAEAEANFRSFLNQQYPPDRFQVLFGALRSDDPALTLAAQLQSAYPNHDIHIVVAPASSPSGTNRKVQNLLAMLPHAKHNLLILADSDMRVRPDYLRVVTAPFRSSPEKTRPVGLVTCPYRGALPLSLAANLEAIGIGADFIPSALVSRMLEGVGFAFGSTIVLPKEVLEKIGGFDCLLNEIADDFLLGQRTRAAGYEVVISPYMVDDVLGKVTFSEMWARRLRWARTVRASRPLGYAGSLVTYGFPLALLWALFPPYLALTWKVLVAVLLLRFFSVVLVTTLTGDPHPREKWYLLPLSDLLSFVLFVASWCGNKVIWRGERFRLLPGGRLERI